MFCAVFWNIDNKAARSGIVRLLSGLHRDQNADLIAVAECTRGTFGALLRALNTPGQPPEFAVVPTTSRVRVLARRTLAQVIEVKHHEYYSILTVDRGSQSSLTLALVHMVSLKEKDAPHIDKELGRFAEAIREVESAMGHSRTVVLGDLNAHPFSDGVASTVGLHGVMSRRVAGREERQAGHRAYPFFFNPMWRFYGEATTEPAGTYYREPKGDHTGYYWHLFDQVLIRPNLLPYYESDSVCIVTSVAGTSLAKADWRPDRAVGSDHFPIRIRLTC